MTYRTSICLSSLMLFAGALPLRAGDLKNPGFEEEGDWQIVKKGENLQAAFDDGASQDGKRSLAVSLPDGTSTRDEDSAGIVQVVELTKADKGISFYVKDNYTGSTRGYHWMELLLDRDVIWEADVAGGDTEWRKVSVDLTRYLDEVKLEKVARNRYEEERNYTITFRVLERRGVSRFGVQVWVDNFTLLKEAPANPQNCEKKKLPPLLGELLVYYDEADLLQPITKPEHFEVAGYCVRIVKRGANIVALVNYGG